MAPVQIIVQDIPHSVGHSKLKIDSACEPDISWEAFLRMHQMNLDKNVYKIKVGKDRFSFLDQPVSYILGTYKRPPKTIKATVKLLSRHRKAHLPNDAVLEQPRSAPVNVKIKHTASHVAPTSTVDDVNLPPSASQVAVPGDEWTRTLMTVQPNTGFGFPYHQNQNLQGFYEEEFLSQVTTNESSQGTSQNSSSEDFARKRKYIDLLEQQPASVFTTLRKELLGLRASGELRVAKWRHYAPLTSTLNLYFMEV